MKKGSFTPASKAQREKVDDLPCLVCGRDRWEAKIDPAHITPRAWGGCDHQDCVVALCRACHVRFDRRGGQPLSILSELVAARDHAVLFHALRHYNCDLLALLHRLTGDEYRPVERRAA